MVWEAVFLLLVLKIPVVYLCVVVWWAIKATPEPEEPAVLVPVHDTPQLDEPRRWHPRHGRRVGPGGRDRRPARRAATGRAAVRGRA